MGWVFLQCLSCNVYIKYWKRQDQTEKTQGKNSRRSVTKQRGRMSYSARAQLLPSSHSTSLVWINSRQPSCSLKPIRGFPMKFQTVAGSKSNTKFLDNSKYGLDVVTMHKDWFSMKLGWILSMLIPKCPQIIDLKTKTSLKDYVRHSSSGLELR